jgi:hypothetical protein
MAQLQRLIAEVILNVILVLVAKAAGDGDPETGWRDLTGGRYTRVFAFGDSLTDTGNSAIYRPTAGGTFTKLPYGETYLGHPCGRASDGRIITDFFGKGGCNLLHPHIVIREL